MRKISKTEVVDGARDYRLMKRKMVNAILDVGEYNRFSKGIFGWVGFRTKWLEYENIERAHGETKWSFWKPVSYTHLTGFSRGIIAVVVSLTVQCINAMRNCVMVARMTLTHFCLLYTSSLKNGPRINCFLYFSKSSFICLLPGILPALKAPAALRPRR